MSIFNFSLRRYLLAIKINQKQIKERSNMLESVRKQLKSEFVGIDKQIDQIISSVKAWYICPEYITRPVIVNLWGITGTFKTSVLRRFVELIDFYAKTSEIDMREITTEFACDKKFSESKKYNKEPHIFIFDEFQNVRTINEDGKEITASRDGLAKFFSLINDGVVKYVREEYYINHIFEKVQDGYMAGKLGIKKSRRTPVVIEDEDLDDYEDTSEETRDVSTFARIQALRMYQYFGLTFEEVSIMSWEKLFNVLSEKIKNLKMEELVDHSKALVFICGNIDEAFAGLTDELDQDLMTPDEFYEESSLVNSSDIKACLLLRFRAEQVARLGQNHCVFPSFNNKMYETLIDKLNKKAIYDFKEQCGQTLTLDNSIKKFLMQNCAIPSQGARSILSSHSYLVNSNIPEAVMLHILHQAKVVKIEVKDLQVVTSSGKHKIIKEIDIINKESQQPYEKETAELVALHEAGHAIVNYAMFGSHAILIKTRNSDSGIGGYCKTDFTNFPTKSDMVKKISVCLGGLVGEILANGEDGYTVGSASDLQKSTAYSTAIVRTYGMGSHIGNSGLTSTQITVSHNKKTDEIEAEDILSEAFLLAFTALLCYKEEWKLLSKALEKKIIIRTEEIKKITGLM